MFSIFLCIQRNFSLFAAMQKHVHVIINPLSGGKNKSFIPELIRRGLSDMGWNISYFITHSETETIERARLSVDEKVYAIIVVGGDGTINNIARFIAGTDVFLGIIAFGSGNGLARYLGTYGSVNRMLDIIRKGNYKALDSGWINNRFFINVCGVGFDAHIGKLFAEAGSRGLKTYAKLTLREFARYSSKHYTMHVDGISHSLQAFMLCVCNGPQFGNNVFIAPEASPVDGLFHITAIHDFPRWKTPWIAGAILRKRHASHPNFTLWKGKNIIIECDEPSMVNIDGEPVYMEKRLQIRLEPASVKVFVP